MYATLADLIARTGADEILQVADRDFDGVADADVVASALASADETINGYLAVRFSIPLVTVPELVAKWAVSIARYHLHRNGPPDYVVRDYNLALAELKDAAAGRMAIPDAAGLQPKTTSAAGQVLSTSDDQVFDGCAFEGWL